MLCKCGLKTEAEVHKILFLRTARTYCKGAGAASRMAGSKKRNGGDFAKQARAAVTLHGADEGSGDITVFSGAEVVSGSSYSVYKTPDFAPENPVYKVKIWDKLGNVTERMVDVSKVDSKNCDTVEMYAYTANLKESGKGSFEDTVLKAVVAKSVKDAENKSGTWSFSEKFDWAKIVNNLMESSYHYGDLKGYMEWKKFLGFLDK